MDLFKNHTTHHASLLVKAFKEGEAPITQYLEALFDFIEKTNPTYNALTSVQKEYALQRAQQLSALSKDDIQKYPLFGVPIILKENIQKKHFPVECASKILKGYTGQFDATAITHLEAAGAILIGTANMDEFAMGSSNEHSAHGPVKNPYDTALVSGGSSGGPAVSCALGFAPLTLGSETGGSVRLPAAFCGIFGFKPSYGRVSRYGLVAYGSSLDQISPFARCAKDLDLLMQVIGKTDPFDATTLDTPYISELHTINKNNFSNITIGVPRNLITQNVSPHVREAFIQLESTLSKQGVQFKDINLDAAKYALDIYYIIACAEASSNLARFDGIRYGLRAENPSDLNDLYCKTRGEGFGFEVKKRIMLGTFALSAGYHDAFYGKALGLRQMLSESLANIFREVDFIYLPTAPDTAFPIGSAQKDHTKEYLYDIFTVLANLAHLPAISVPAHHPHSKLPIGLQFMAPKRQDAKLIDLAYYLETKGFIGERHESV